MVVKRITRWVAAMLLCGLLPGRILAQDEGPPASPAPPTAAVALPFELPVVAPGEAITLEQALGAADERNLSLAAAREDIASAQGELYRSWATLFPTASGTLTLTHNDQADKANMGGLEIVTRKQDSLSGAVELRMPVVHPQAWLGVKVGKQGLELAEISVDNARQALLLTVAQAYYQALTARALIDVQEAQIRSSARHLEVASTRHVSGVGSRLDVIRTRSEMERVRVTLLAAHSALDNARDALAILCGLDGLPMPAVIVELAPPKEGDDQLIERARDQRQDLRMRRAAVDLNEALLDTSWMQFLPNLNASWQLTHQFTDPSDFGSQDRTRWAAYLVLAVPIYSQTRYADLDVKRAAVRKAEIEAEDAEQRAALEVRTARRDYLTAMEQVQAAAVQSDLAGQVLTLSENAYVAGTGSSLVVTDARRSSREAEVTLVTKRFEAQVALLKLMRSFGQDMTALGE